MSGELGRIHAAFRGSARLQPDQKADAAGLAESRDVVERFQLHFQPACASRPSLHRYLFSGVDFDS